MSTEFITEEKEVVTRTKVNQLVGVNLELTLVEAAKLALILGDRCGMGECGVYKKLDKLGFNTIGFSSNEYEYDLCKAKPDVDKLVKKVKEKYDSEHKSNRK